MPNPAGKQRHLDNGDEAYMVWRSLDGTWTWEVIKSWQQNNSKPGARWFCRVITPMTGPRGDIGDVYVHDIVKVAGAALISYDKAVWPNIDALNAYVGEPQPVQFM